MHQHLRQSIWDVSDRQKGLSAYIQHENHEVVCSPYIYFVDIFNQKKSLKHPKLVYSSSFAMTQLQTYRGQICMLDWWHVCLCETYVWFTKSFWCLSVSSHSKRATFILSPILPTQKCAQQSLQTKINFGWRYFDFLCKSYNLVHANRLGGHFTAIRATSHTS